MKNLTEAVGLALVRCWTKRQQTETEAAGFRRSRHDAPPLPTWRRGVPAAHSTEEQGHLVHQAARAVEYEQMLALRAQGLRVPEIAGRLGKSAGTVRRWLAQGAAPEGTHRRQRSSRFEAYVPYVLERWQAGCHNGLQLWREITERGYGGTARMVYRFIAALRTPPEPWTVIQREAAHLSRPRPKGGMAGGPRSR